MTATLASVFSGKPIIAGMARRVTGAAFVAGLLFAAAPAAAQFGPPEPCTREVIQKVTDSYIEAQKAGDPIKMPLRGEWLNYNEQFDTAGMGNGIISKPQKIDFHRTIIDVPACQSFTEVVITDPAHPYVLGTLLSIRSEGVGGIDTIITDKEDWLFNAANTLKYSKAEKWTPIPEAERDTREVLMAAANAYLNSFNDKNVQVPWGTPCARLEGGLYTAKGAPGVASPQDTCNVGVPSNVKLTERRYVVDPDMGAVTVLMRFGNNALPDAHTFRIEKGKIRYVHTITVCKTANCGFPVPAELQNAK
jgi:hypothetical protein